MFQSGATNKCRLQRLPAAQHLRARRGKLPLAMSPVLAWAVGPCRRLATIGACRLLFKERPAGFLSQPRNPGRLVKRKFPLCTANRLPGTHNPSKSSAPGTLLERKFVLCTGILGSRNAQCRAGLSTPGVVENAVGTLLERLALRLAVCIWVCWQPRPSPTCRWERLFPSPLPWSRLQTACGQARLGLAQPYDVYRPRAARVPQPTKGGRPDTALETSKSWRFRQNDERAFGARESFCSRMKTGGTVVAGPIRANGSHGYFR